MPLTNTISLEKEGGPSIRVQIVVEDSDDDLRYAKALEGAIYDRVSELDPETGTGTETEATND